MMASDLSILTGLEGYDQTYSLSEFKEHLEVDLSTKECERGWLFWRPERCQQSEYELDNISPFDLLMSVEIKDKIKRVLDEMVSHKWQGEYLVQFWPPQVVDQQHLYLTTSDQPFVVGRLCKGLCWYRNRCMDHHYRVDEGAQQEELGAVGRVYRNGHPESTPDLRLYSTKEFPLRDDAACCGLRSYLALPVFDKRKEKCYGVLEVLCFDHIYTEGLNRGLKAAQLRTTHLNFNFSNIAARDVDSEITKMLELAVRLMPQLQMALVWVPCHECSNTSNNLNCMERATFLKAKEANSLDTVDDDLHNYLLACSLHHLQIGKHTNMIGAMMSSNNKSCFCRNICDLSISENPLAHYAQKARLSSCFAIRLQSLYSSSEIYLVEFFLQYRKDAFAGSFLPLLLRIMEMEVENFTFPYERKSGDELVVEVLKQNMLSSGESCQSSALRYESTKYHCQLSDEISIVMEMTGCDKRYQLPDFTKYVQKAYVHRLQPFENFRGFLSWAREELVKNEVDSDSSSMTDHIQEKIKCLMREIVSKWDSSSSALAQFWAPKKDMDRFYLETSGQPIAFSDQGLAFFRKQCMEHFYFVDEGVKEDELGPPGRVFLNGHPEITPDLRLYSPTEFPLRNHAAHFGLRKYLALPVFDLNRHKCVGVLEVVQSRNSNLDVLENAINIQNALKVANLSSTHNNFKPSFLGSHLPGNVNPYQSTEIMVALTEIQEACEVFAKFPQLYVVEVWVPYSNCPSNNNTLSCMERVWATKEIRELNLPMCQIQHVETGKGIAGLALASENKSCFCRNLCEFSIAEQPFAHYAQLARLDVCFAMCLQSSHTGDLLYVLEFYVNQGPGEYDYLRSFLCLLLPIMKQKLRSFKVASGQQLGEKLVVEVIEFSEANELAFSELDQADVFPVTFKFVQYGQNHFKDKKVQFPPEVVESVSSVEQAERCSTSAANLKKKDAAKKSNGGRTKTRLNIEPEDLKPYFGQKLKNVAMALGVSKSTIKRRCRDYNIKMWPWNENHKKNRSLFMRESARDSQQNTCLSCFSNLPPLDVPLHQNLSHTNPKSSQLVIVQPKVDMVVIKAKYEDNTFKFQLYNTAGMEKLVEEVAMRLNLKTGSFKLKYLDEDNDKILLACDADLQLCLKSLAAMSKTCIEVFVQSI